DLYGSAGGIHDSRRRAEGLPSPMIHLWLKASLLKLEHTFDEVIRGYDFVKNDYDPCVYKKVSGSSILFLVLYVDDILLIGNDIKMLGDTKAWLSTQFSMKDLGEASYIFGIKIFRDRSKRMLGMTQNSYVEKILKRFKMEHSKRGFLPMRHGVKMSKKQSPKTDEELKRMLDISYASVVGSIQYAAQCTRPDIAYAFSVTSRYQACAGEAHWTAVKTILNDASFQSDDDDAKSQSGFVFKLNGGVVAWKSSKQDTTADSTTEAEYIAASEAAKEAVWMKNYIQELGVVPSIAEPVVIFCDNNGAIAQAKELRSHHRSKHILRRYHLLREMVGRGDVRMDRVSSAENTADPLTKPVSQIAHAQHLGKMGLSTKSPHPLSGCVLIFGGSLDRDLGSRRPTESTLEAELENNNALPQRFPARPRQGRAPVSAKGRPRAHAHRPTSGGPRARRLGGLSYSHHVHVTAMVPQVRGLISYYQSRESQSYRPSLRRLSYHDSRESVQLVDYFAN
ncbi:UNVERIFIED_CONTAM: Retrovirus-related Pol polyprotein from transposon TNT 1-94, partial [Sesamum calycinum]